MIDRLSRSASIYRIAPCLKVLGKLVYFLPSDDHTDYRSLCIVSEKDFLYTGLVFFG